MGGVLLAACEAVEVATTESARVATMRRRQLVSSGLFMALYDEQDLPIIKAGFPHFNDAKNNFRA